VDMGEAASKKEIATVVLARRRLPADRIFLGTKHLRGRGGRNMTRLPHGIDITSLARANEKPVTLAMGGRCFCFPMSCVPDSLKLIREEFGEVT
jgi:hypothetical protein